MFYFWEPLRVKAKPRLLKDLTGRGWGGQLLLELKPRTMYMPQALNLRFHQEYLNLA